MTDMPAVRVLDNNVLVKRAEAATTSAGGIVIPESAKERPKEGHVVAVGSGRALDNGQRQPTQVKPGDRILFTAYAGTEIKIDGQQYVVMNEADILAIIEN